MSPLVPASSTPTTLRWRPVVVAGLAAGAIDILYACAFWFVRTGTAPRRIVQSVAAGLMGPAAFAAGSASAALGLFLHFGIALVVAVVFAVGARRWPRLVDQPWRSGALYGLVVYAVMNGVVLPLSAAGPPAGDPLWIALTLAVHALGIGVPVALGARAALRPGAFRRHEAAGLR